MRTRNARTTDARGPLRLRVPASLVIAIVGAAATATLSFGGCQDNQPDPVDAGLIDRVRDSGLAELDSGTADAAQSDVTSPDG